MANKILISLIGTGRNAKGDDTNNKYETTDYLIDGKLYKNETFTTNAIVKHYGINKLFLIGTNKSMWDNIAEVYGADEDYIFYLLEKKENNSLKEEDLEKLNSILEKKLGGESRCFIIEDGESEDELWSIFEKFLEILDFIENEDELYFDITHLFRSVSVMSFIFADFGRIYKKYNLKGVFYGMLRKNQPSLIINVNIFFELLKWARAIEEMENFASFNKLITLLEGKLNEKGLNALKRTNEAFSIANLTAVHNSINNLSNHLDYLENNDNKIVKLISPKIKDFIRKLNKKKLSDFQFAIAEFFASKNNYAIAYVALAEAILTKICEVQGLDANEKENRDKAKEWIKEGFNIKNFGYKNPRKKLAELCYNKIFRVRNNICHQLETSKNAKHDIENFDRYLQKSKELLNILF